MRHQLVAIGLLVLSSLAWAAPAPPAELPVSVELALSRTPGAATAPARVDATLILRNTGPNDLTLQHPQNRMALAFLVLDDSGLPVMPKGVAKVESTFMAITLKSGATERIDLRTRIDVGTLQFHTQTALFGYDLTPGHTYRVIAVYRPDAEKSPGICSREVLFKFE